MGVLLEPLVWDASPSFLVFPYEESLPMILGCIPEGKRKRGLHCLCQLTKWSGIMCRALCTAGT